MNAKRRPGQSRLAEGTDDTPHYHGHRERLRRLRQHEERYSAELVEAFRRSAEGELRRDPREAGRRAQLGFVVADALKDARGRVVVRLDFDHAEAADAAELVQGFSRKPSDATWALRATATTVR